MKIRNGFVSNSSSSSFLLASHSKLTKENLIKCFQVSKTSPLFPIVKKIIKIILDESKKYTLTNYVKEAYCVEENDVEEEIKNNTILKKIKKKGFKNIYLFYASDEGGGIEAALCEMEIKYEDKDILIEKEGGY